MLQNGCKGDEDMKLTFLGAAHEVTGSCHMLEACGKIMLVDCGMEQGPDIYENQQIPVDASRIDYVFLTHAHIDHSGLLPLLYKKGFRGTIYMTYATWDLCDIMLRDSAHIQMFEAEWRNRKAKRSGKPEYVPLYTMEDAAGAIKQFCGCPYGERISITDQIEIRFTDVGHLLGSACIEIWVREEEKETKLVFSGDIGNVHQPILKDPHTLDYADYVIMESTYGDRSHGERPDYVAELTKILQETFDRGGNVVIPSFAVGRTQEMLYFLREIKNRGLVTGHPGELTKILQETFDRGGNVVIPSFAVGRTQEMLYFLREIKNRGLVTGHPGFKVYVDSPLAVQATTVFNKNMYECFDEETLSLVKSGVNPISFPGLCLSITSDESKAINFDEEPKVKNMYECFDEETLSLVKSGVNPISFPGLCLSITSDESKAINFDEEPKVILSASGMCEAGRIRHHLKHNLWRPESTVLFVGYQAAGTLGRTLVEGASEVRLFGEPVEVRAHIRVLAGISGHADRQGLIRWLEGFRTKPRRIFIVHGEDEVCDRFAACLRDELGYGGTTAP